MTPTRTPSLLPSWTVVAMLAALSGCATTQESTRQQPLPESNCPAGAEATLRGRVVTEHDDPVVGAAVTFISPSAFPQTVGTDQTGTFRIACIPPGENYEIRIDEPGYRPFRREEIRAKAPVSDLRITLQRRDLIR